MKISTQLQFDRAASQMGTLTANLAHQQSRISAGEAFIAPREAPQAATTLLRLDSLKAGQETRSSLLDRAEARARTQEASLRSATDILMRVKEIAIRANNGTYNAVDRETFALEVRSLNDQLLALANTQDAEGNAVFAGAATGSLAFQKDAEGIVHYQGDTTDVELSVGRNRALNIARPGTTFFSSVAVPEGARVSSDTELAGFTVETSIGAEAAQYSVAVTQLARAQKTTSSVFSSASLPLNGGNPLSLAVGQNGTIATLTVDPPTPQAIADALNSAGLGVSAQVSVVDAVAGTVSLEVEGETGEEAAFTLTDPSGELGWTESLSAQNAEIQVNGRTLSGADNAIELAEGVSIVASTVGSAEAFEIRTRDDFFTVMESFAEELEANAPNQDRALFQLEHLIGSLSLGLARVGTDLVAVDQTREVMAEEQLQTEALISDLRDLDFAEAITKLRADQLALEAAQSSFARIARQSLFDFLR